MKKNRIYITKKKRQKHSPSETPEFSDRDARDKQ